MGSMGGGIFSTIASGYDSYRTNSAMLAAQSKNRKWQDYLIRNAIQIRVDDAKRAGINPLVALGMNPAVGNVGTPQLNQTDTSGLQMAGQAADDLIHRVTDKRGKEIQELNIMEKKLDLQRKMLENVGLMRDIGRTKNVKTVPIGKDPVSQMYGIVGEPDQAQSTPCEYSESCIIGQDGYIMRVPSQVPYQNPRGFAAGTIPMNQYVNDAEGGTAIAVSKDMEERYEDDPLNRYTYMVIQGKRRAEGLRDWAIGQMNGKFLRTKEAVALRNVLRKYRPAAPRGWEQKYDPWTGKFYLIKLKPDRSNSGFYWKKNQGIPYNEELPGKVVDYELEKRLRKRR